MRTMLTSGVLIMREGEGGSPHQRLNQTRITTILTRTEQKREHNYHQKYLN